jgi:hypothetical protein
VRSYGSASVTAAYAGPLPGTLCYDGSCWQAAPGYYTAPAREVIKTWTTSYTESCPTGYTGSVTVTEQWQTVKYWTPNAGGCPRGGLRFDRFISDKLVDVYRQENCIPEKPSDSTTTNSTNPPGPLDHKLDDPSNMKSCRFLPLSRGS